MSGITNFFRSMWQEIKSVIEMLGELIISIFEPQSGWVPKAIFGLVMLVIIFIVAKRGTKS